MLLTPMTEKLDTELVLQPFNSVPLAEQVQKAILSAILRGQFVEKLPTEDVLAGMLNVSRTTVRAALQGLEQEGVITRRRAVGTTINRHVRPSALTLQRLVGFAELLREKGYDVRVEADRSRAERVPADVAEAFAGPLLEDQEVFLTDTRFFADDHLAMCIRDVVPWSKLRDGSRLPDEPAPARFDFTRPYLVQPVDHAVVEIVAAVSRPGTTRLPVTEGEAFTRLLERHYAVDGELMAVSLIDVDNHYAVFEIVRRR
jgi:GntR family transcriptional regulator